MIFLVPEDSEILSLLLDLLLDLPLLYRSAWLVQCCQDRFDYTVVTKDPASCGTFITLSPHQPWVSCSLLPVVFSWGLLSCAHGPAQTEYCWQWSHFKFLSRSDAVTLFPFHWPGQVTWPCLSCAWWCHSVFLERVEKWVVNNFPIQAAT